MKKGILAIFFVIATGSGIFSQVNNPVSTILTIQNVVVDGGKIYVYFYSNEKSWKDKQPDISLEIDPTNNTVSRELNLVSGEYVISIYQDANNNDKCDTGIFGIPKELIGMSNFYGKGYPASTFAKLKMPINAGVGELTLGLYKL